MNLLRTIAALALVSSVSALQSINHPVICGPNVTYPINGSLPLVDYDVNCNILTAPLNNQTTTLSTWWFPRTMNMSFYSASNPSINQTILRSAIDITNIRRPSDPQRDRFSFELRDLPTNKLPFPVDIRPSIMPIATIEMFVRLIDSSAGSEVFLFSTGSAGSSNRSSPARSLMPADDSTNEQCSHHLHPYGASQNVNCVLSTSSFEGFVHIVTTFDASNQTATIWLNGRFSQSFNVSTVDDLTILNINGRVGTNFYDVASMSLVYLRVWNRYLSQNEMRLLNEDWFAAYNKPILTNPFPAVAFDPQAPLSASVSGGLTFNELQQYTLNGNSSALLSSGYGHDVSDNAAGLNYRYSASFRVCRYPSREYTVSPFFATTDLCDLSIVTNATVLSGVEPLQVQSILSAGANLDERYVSGASGTVRVSHYVRFSRAVKQASVMPVTQKIFRGEGFEFVDSLPLTVYPSSNISSRDSWTRLSEDRRYFLWEFDLTGSRPPQSVRASLPDASLWPITDDQDIPLAFNQTVRTEATEFWQTINQTVITGLQAIIVPDALGPNRTSSGAYELGFDLLWNAPVTNFNLIADVHVCTGCLLVGVMPIDESGMRYNYRVRTPILEDDQKFRASLSLSNTSRATDADYPWSTLDLSAGAYPAMTGSYIINDDGEPDETEQADRVPEDLSITKEALAGCIIGGVLAFLLFIWLFSWVAKRRTNDRLAGHLQHPKPAMSPKSNGDVAKPTAAAIAATTPTTPSSLNQTIKQSNNQSIEQPVVALPDTIKPSPVVTNGNNDNIVPAAMAVVP